MIDALDMAARSLLMIAALCFSPFGFAPALTLVALVRGWRAERRL